MTQERTLSRNYRRGAERSLKSSQTNKKTWLWLVVVLVLFIGISYALSSGQPEDYPDFISESPAPSGSKAFYTYLKNKAHSPKRWENDPELLPEDEKNHLLLMIEPFFVPNSEQMKEYINFMESGNTIILFNTNPDGLYELKVEPVRQIESETTHVRTSSGQNHEAFVPSHVRLLEEAQDDILLEDDQGVIALKRSFGEGELVVANSPYWLTNENITEVAHVELLFFLFETDTAYNTIYFDEFIHGSGHAPSVTALYPKWLLTLALQLLLLTLFWLWYQGKRFGPLRQPREATVRFSNEKTSALAAWYQRGRRYQDSIVIQADYLKLLLQEKWGIPYQKGWQECNDMLIQKESELTKESIYSFTNGLTNLLNKESINKQEYLSWSKKIDKLKREVEQE